MLRGLTLSLSLLCLPFLSPLALASTEGEASKPDLKIQRVTPSGKDVPARRQIVFQFNQPVVPVGKMDRDASEIPITIAPTLNCEWRWLNTSALACQLTDADALVPATRYRILVQPGIKTEDGRTIAAPHSHEFITQRPKSGYTRFKTWRAPGMPDIRVNFNQPVSRDSVEEFIHMQQEDGKKFPVEARIDLDARPDAWIRAKDGSLIKFTFPKKEEKQELSASEQPEFARTWLISPKDLLKENTLTKLRIEPGLKSSLGPENGIEKRTIVTFVTFPEFKFAGVSCENNSGHNIRIKPDESIGENLNRRCNPLSRVGLSFTAPVIKEILRDNLTITPDLAGGRKDYDPWENAYSYSNLSRPHRKGRLYTVWFPEYLKAWNAYHLKAASAEFKDEFGRSLPEPINMFFATNHRLPDYHFGHHISVLEKGLDTEVPVVVTNLDSLNFNYNVLTTKSSTENRQTSFELPEAMDIAYSTPLHVRKLIPGESGVVQGRLSSTPTTGYEPSWFFAQVTPFHVQIKVGHYNTLVWITDFATGQPVAGVDVSIYPGLYSGLEENPADTLAKAITDAKGVAMLPGTQVLDPKLDYLNSYSDNEPRLFVRATKEDDMALLALDYNFALNMYQLSEGEVYGYSRQRYGHIKTWGTTAQGVYKVGDTIQYKILVRDQSNTALVPPPKKGYHLLVTDPTGKTVHEVKDLTLSEFGGHAGEFTLPKTAAVGWYDFELKANFTDNSYWRPMRVLVSDFTPSPFRVTTQLNGELFKLGETITVDTSANLHAGGPYADAHTRVHASLRQGFFSSKDPDAKGFHFDTWQDEVYGSEVVHEVEGEVDSKGQLKTEFKLADTQILYGTLSVESAVRDDRGKNVASSSSAKFVGRDRFVGLKQTAWVLKEEQSSSVLTQVVNEHGKPAPGSKVKVLVERRETKASRVKGAGNAYLTKYEHKWVNAAECSLTSVQKPAPCEFTPEHPGLYRITATIKDTQNRDHSTQLSQWVAGKGQVVWEIPTGYGLPITPEQESWTTGEKARYLINNPYPGAKALITIERYGVIKSWVQTFENSIEVLEFDIEPDFIPGFYLSVMVMSPRVDKPLGDGKVDLGKPAFRMGYVKTDVRDPYKEMLVDIKTDKAEYRPRDKVTVQLHAKARQADADIGPIELAVAVLDESVFDLLSQGRAYFDPYKGFYGLEDLDMRNYNLLQHLIGRQKFEKKGANPGGDGGGSDLSLRSLFKFVSYWNPSIKTDADGKATIDFELPDNLTGWRVLAMAVTPGERMGLGDENFKVNQPIEVRPVLPNQITEGDSFEAGFSVMNRTSETRSLNVQINARHRNGGQEESIKQTVKAEPYKRYTVWLPLEKMPEGEIELIAHAADSEEQDGMTKSLIVRKRRSLHTGATYGTTTDAEISESIAFPEDIYADAGGLNLIMSPSIINGVEGAFEYMRDYPYACWEQKLSKGTMASHFKNLKPWLSDELTWDGSAELPEETLQVAAEHQAPNGGMTYYIPQNRYTSPYLSAYTALAFNWLRDSGYQIPSEVEGRLHAYLNNMLKKDVMPTFFSPGMAATVRAVALAALAKQGKVTLADLNRYQPHVKDMSLFGKSQFLSAALRVAGTQAMQKQTVDMILAHANQSGGKFTFSETLDDSYSRILASSLRDNCSILSGLTAYAEKGGKDYVGDVPFKLTRSIIAARKSRTHWPNTQENMFCMNALIDYSRVYEKDKPAMQVRAWLGDDSLGETRFDDLRDPAVTMKHEMQPTDPGRKAKLKITKDGQGRLYYGVHVRYAPKEEKAEAVNSGIEVRREYHVERDGKWQLLTSPMQLKTGELVRVDLYLSLPAPRNFVVVDDPVPGGLEPVNRDLATASQVDANKAGGQYSGGSFWFKFGDWNEFGGSFWSFYHKELRHHAAIFYSDYLSAGNYHLSYVAQAIAPGDFAVMPTHSEEMYEPDVYGKGKPARLQVVRE